MGHVYQSGRPKDRNEMNDIHSDVGLRVKEVEVGWMVGWGYDDHER